MTELKKDILRWLGIVALVATTSYVTLLFAIPYGIMWIAITVLGNRMETNVLFHSERPNYDNQEIVRSSPDLIYSACTFDVSEYPIHLTAPLTDSYMSLSMYAMDTSCFFVRNDLQVPEGFDVVVLGPDDGEITIDGTITVRAPTNWGFLLFRNFAGNGAQVEKIENIRRQAKIVELR